MVLIFDINPDMLYGDGSIIVLHVFAAAICENDNVPVAGNRDGIGVSVMVGVGVNVGVGVGLAITSPQH